MVYYPDNLLVLWLFKDFRFFLLDLLQNLSELLTTFSKPHDKRGPVYFLANVGSEKFLTVSHQKGIISEAVIHILKNSLRRNEDSHKHVIRRAMLE